MKLKYGQSASTKKCMCSFQQHDFEIFVNNTKNELKRGKNYNFKCVFGWLHDYLHTSKAKINVCFGGRTSTNYRC